MNIKEPEGRIWDPSAVEYRKSRIEAMSGYPPVVALRTQMQSFAPLFSDMPLLPAYSYDDIVIFPGCISPSFRPDTLEMCIPTTTGKRCGPILLHELLHFHQDFLSDNVDKQQLIDDLHAKLIKKLPLLDSAYNRIDEVLDLVQAEKPDPAQHDYLFFLKSVDLDLQRRYKPGTVFGYKTQLAFPICL